jgi:hypothetical protein
VRPTEVVKQLTERWGGDRAAVEELVHPDVVIDMTIRVLNPEVYGETEIHSLAERGHEVLLVRTTPMRGKLSGVEFSEPVAQRYVVEDGVITRMTLLTDVDRAVADFEAGRPPHPPAE